MESQESQEQAKNPLGFDEVFNWRYITLGFFILYTIIILTWIFLRNCMTEIRTATKSSHLKENSKMTRCFCLQSDDKLSHLSSNWSILSNDTIVDININDMNYRVPLSMVTPCQTIWEFEKIGRLELEGNRMSRSISYPFLNSLYSRYIPKNYRHPLSCGKGISRQHGKTNIGIQTYGRLNNIHKMNIYSKQEKEGLRYEFQPKEEKQDFPKVDSLAEAEVESIGIQELKRENSHCIYPSNSSIYTSPSLDSIVLDKSDENEEPYTAIICQK